MSRNRSLGSISVRRITLFVSAVLVALFTVLLPIPTPVHAQTASDAVTWSGDSLSLELAEGGSITLSRSEVLPRDNPNIPNLVGSECQDNPNTFFSAPGTWSDDSEYSWLYIVCLSSGDDGSDKSQSLPAMLLKYRAPPGTDRAEEFNEREEPATEVTIPAENTSADETITSSCSTHETFGLGWIICPTTNFLAAGMDALFTILSGFLTVPPLANDRSGPLYYLWGLMRNIANMLFIAGFLIIIYSQITSAGISNYGIKRLLPRLVIAAVLVNTSYWITAIAVDLSNIFGVSLQNLFVGIRETIPADQGSDFDASTLSWGAMATAVLTGSTAAAFGVASVAGTLLATAGGSLWLLLVGLAGALLSILVAILLLAARQALIIILIIVSPLAFVAFLLPATDSWFQRWRSLFMTMLLVFPMFSLVFGGAQLAGLAIIHTAEPSNDNFFTLVILGMIVQVAPVIITPLLIKLSGSLLGRVAGLVNNPNRGIVDQTRKFAEGRRDQTKYRQLYDKDGNGRYKNNNPLAQMGRWSAGREMDKAQKLKSWQSGADALWEQDDRSHEVHRQTTINEMIKSEGENKGKAAVEQDIANNVAVRRLYTQQQISKETAENVTSQNKTTYEAGRTKPLSETDVALQALYTQASKVYQDTHQETERQSRITKEQEERFYDTMDKNEGMQNYAGATDIVGDAGKLRAKVTAQTKLMAASSERVKNYEQSFLFDNIDKDTALKKATREIYTNDEEWEAAINHVFESRDDDNIIKLHEKIKLTPSTPTGIRQAFELAAKKSQSKPIFATASRLGGVAQGEGLRIDGDGDKLTTEWQLEALEKGKYGTSDLVQKASKEEVIRLTRILREIKAAGDRLEDRISADAIALQRERVRDVFKDPRMYTHLGDKEKFMKELGKELGLADDDFNPKTK